MKYTYSLTLLFIYVYCGVVCGKLAGLDVDFASPKFPDPRISVTPRGEPPAPSFFLVEVFRFWWMYAGGGGRRNLNLDQIPFGSERSLSYCLSSNPFNSPPIMTTSVPIISDNGTGYSKIG